MKAKKTNTWQIILNLWEEHQGNPKYANDKSEVNLCTEENDSIRVTHSFVFTNQKKLQVLNEEIHCLLAGKKIDLHEFSQNTISKNYTLPIKPTCFQNVQGEKRIHQLRDSISEQIEDDSENPISNLLPFAQKKTDEQDQLDDASSNKSYKAWRKYSTKIIAVIIPIILLTVIINIATGPIIGKKQPTSSSKVRPAKRKVQLPGKKISKRKTASKIKRKKVVKRDRPKNIRKTPKKLAKRRKALMKRRTKKMPASLENEERSPRPNKIVENNNDKEIEEENSEFQDEYPSEGDDSDDTGSELDDREEMESSDGEEERPNDSYDEEY